MNSPKSSILKNKTNSNKKPFSSKSQIPNSQLLEDEAIQNKVLTEENLNEMLFQLKRYYNDLNLMRTRGEDKLNNLEDKNKLYNKKIAELESLKDINLSQSNKLISIKDQGIFVQPKEKIEERIMNIIEQKKNLEHELTNEEEYSNTLNYMIDCEKVKIGNINKQIISYEEKSKIVNLTKKNFEQNEVEQRNKEISYHNLNKILDKETIKINEILEKQQSDIVRINEEVSNDKNVLVKRKTEVEELERLKKKELNDKKQEILNKINETQNTKEQNISKETYYIKLIIGLYLLQKHFLTYIQNKELTLDSFNEKDILDSKEYQQFISENYVFDVSKRNTISIDNKLQVLESNSFNNTRHNSEFNNKFRSASVFKSDKKNNSNAKTITKQNDKKQPMTINNNDNEAFIDINDLKHKFDHIDIDFEKLYDFYTKLNSQITHYHNTMMTFNLKQVNLESKKDLYTIKVKEILRKNYKNFNELIRNNSKFKNFMLEYQTQIRKENEYLINSQVLKSEKIPSEYSEFYFKCSSLISEFKSFYEFIFNK